MKESQMPNHKKSARRGFTLIELVAVILVLAILAGLVMVGGRAALQFFRGVNDKATIDNIAKALELYKNKYGEYPPDGTDRAAVKRHLLKRDPSLTKKTVGNLLIEDIDRLREIYDRTSLSQPDETTRWYEQNRNIVRSKVLAMFTDLAINNLMEELADADVAINGQMLTYWLCGEDWVLYGRNRWNALVSAGIEELEWLNEHLDKLLPYVFQQGNSDFIDTNPGFSSPSEIGTARSKINYNIAACALCNSKGYPVVYFKANKTAKDKVFRWLHFGNVWDDPEGYEFISYQNGESFYNEVELSGEWEPYAAAETEFDVSLCAAYFNNLTTGSNPAFGLHPYRHSAGHTGERWYASDTYQLILPGEDGYYVPDPDDPTTAKAEMDNVTNFCAGATMAEEDFEGKAAQ